MAIERDSDDTVTQAKPRWTTLERLRKGAIFETRDGVRAVKSEYRYDSGQCECVLLSSGESAHFKNGNAEEVREIKIP